MFHIYHRVYRFTNHHNGASCSKTMTVYRDQDASDYDRYETAYLSGDNYRRSEFGNGETVVDETFIGVEDAPRGEMLPALNQHELLLSQGVIDNLLEISLL